MLRDMRLLIDAEIDALAEKDKTPGIPLQVTRNDLTNAANGCECRAYFLNAKRLP
jgi:hypothetical protein